MTAYIILVIYLTWLAIGTDRRDRIQVPYRNGERLGDCRVLILRRWANQRVGLANHLQLPRSCGVLIANTRGVHTAGMNFPIDVVVLTQAMVVERVIPSVKPGQKLRFPSRRWILELGPGVAPYWRLSPGARLEFQDA